MKISKNTVALCALVLAGAPAAASADGYAIDWWTIDGGGVMGAAGGAYELSGTIGQPDAGPVMSGSGYVLEGGFWGGGVTVTTDVEEAEAGEGVPAGAPAAFRAYAGAPNPFRERASVSFDLPGKQAVHLSVYDLTGRLRRTLHDGQMEAGRHELIWDGRDDDGRDAASGAYFVVLRTPSGEHREKLVKVR